MKRETFEKIFLILLGFFIVAALSTLLPPMPWYLYALIMSVVMFGSAILVLYLSELPADIRCKQRRKREKQKELDDDSIFKAQLYSNLDVNLDGDTKNALVRQALLKRDIERHIQAIKANINYAKKTIADRTKFIQEQEEVLRDYDDALESSEGE